MHGFLPQTALIVRFSAIGDCIMAAWAATALRKELPDIRIDWAATGNCAPVLDTDQLVDEVIVFRRKAWKQARWKPATWRDQLRTYLSLRSRQYDVGFDFQGHSKTALALRIAKPRRRLALKGTDIVARQLNPVIHADLNSIHTVEQNHQLISEIGDFEIPERPIMPQTELPAGVPAEAVVIGTGAGHPDKIWPVQRWSEAAESLMQAGHQVVITGASGDPVPEAAGAVNMVGRLSLHELTGLVRASRLVLAGDTGIGHLAAAYGVPSVSVFGPTDPVVFRPYSDAAVCLKNGSSTEDVSTAELIEAAAKQLDPSAVWH